METIRVQPLTAEAFTPFGDVIDFDRAPDFQINKGMCDRYHGLAQPEVVTGNVSISLARAKPYELPLTLEMMERHPLGSQTFMPLGHSSFLVIVAPDTGHGPGAPLAFRTAPGQGINYRLNTWHAVLTPMSDTGDFLIIDRHQQEGNLEEHFFDAPFLIVER